LTPLRSWYRAFLAVAFDEGDLLLSATKPRVYAIAAGAAGGCWYICSIE
jgi:hypothetical protein